jgi:hypothetical protein
VQLFSFTATVIILNSIIGSRWTFTWRFLVCCPTLSWNFRSIKIWEGTAIRVNRGCTSFVIYFLLTCGLPIWQQSFSYKEMAACFGNLLTLQGSLMGCNIVSKWQKFINILKSFSYKDSLFIIARTRKEDFRINSTFTSDFLVYLGLFKGDKSDSSIFRILIFGFLLFYYFLLSLWVIITYLGQL